MRDYNNYYVKVLVQVSPIEYNRKYGVFMKRPEDTTHIHCDDEEIYYKYKHERI